jgi:hypothetical protein
MALQQAIAGAMVPYGMILREEIDYVATARMEKA